MSPINILMVVVFPAPFGPEKTEHFPTPDFEGLRPSTAVTRFPQNPTLENLRELLSLYHTDRS